MLIFFRLLLFALYCFGNVVLASDMALYRSASSAFRASCGFFFLGSSGEKSKRQRTLNIDCQTSNEEEAFVATAVRH
jgi:hypothetical protein